MFDIPSFGVVIVIGVVAVVDVVVVIVVGTDVVVEVEVVDGVDKVVVPATGAREGMIGPISNSRNSTTLLNPFSASAPPNPLVAK